MRGTNAERDRSSGPGVPEVLSGPAVEEERSRSVGCASVSIGAKCYPAPV
ncbi:hypothetical protein [Streptomyces sp. NPDC004976]